MQSNSVSLHDAFSRSVRLKPQRVQPEPPVQERRAPTDLECAAGPVLVVVADSLQLTASRKLPGDELQSSPQTFTVEEHKELSHDPAGERTAAQHSDPQSHTQMKKKSKINIKSKVKKKVISFCTCLGKTGYSPQFSGHFF